MIAGYRSNKASNINPLSMALNGVIDAAVMGGTDNYEKAFFVPEYVKDHPEDEPRVQLLKKLIKDQVSKILTLKEIHPPPPPHPPISTSSFLSF